MRSPGTAAAGPLGGGVVEAPFARRNAWGSGGRHSLLVASRFANFAVIGAVCTVAFALLYNAFRLAVPPLGANVGALSLTMVVNFAANRRFTFEAEHGPVARQALQYGVAYVIGLAGSTLALHVALVLFPAPGALLETLLAVGAGAVATVTRFVLLSAWVFRPAPAPAAPPAR